MLKKGVGRNSLNVYLSSDRFLRRVFSLLRAGRILYMYIYIALAWRHGLHLSKILSTFFTRSLASDPASSHGDLIFKTLLHPEFGMRLFSPRPLFQNWFSLPLFPLTEEAPTSTLVFWPIISLFSSFPWSQSENICCLSFCMRSVRTTISSTRVRLQSTDSLTHILYFLRQAGRSWPTFF